MNIPFPTITSISLGLTAITMVACSPGTLSGTSWQDTADRTSSGSRIIVGDDGSHSNTSGEALQEQGAESDGDDADGNGSGGGDKVTPSGPVLAFPGAEGFGASATGGRGGRVIKVTSLAADGPGTLQAALDQSGPRIIVFAVSGVITADKIVVRHGDVTIAGQTAPGAGITIRAPFYGEYDESVSNIIVRHLRIRPDSFGGGGGEQHDALQFSVNSNMIFDHISVAFGVDETMDLYSARDVTVQWSTIECSATQGHPEGQHNYGLINGPEGRRVAIHHNLFAHHKNRNPAISSGPAEVRNNVIYNVHNGFVHHNPARGQFNIVGNTYRQGPSGDIVPFYFDDENGFSAANLAYYLRDNYIDAPGDYQGVVDDPWADQSLHSGLEHLNAPNYLRAATEFSFTGQGSGFVSITTQDSQSAYDLVLQRAGGMPRDRLTRDVVQETRDRNGSWGARSLSNPLQGLTPGQSPQDSDGDGMADAWELDHGLDPAEGEDHRQVMPSGYTAIEDYINGLADQLAQ